MLLPDEGIGGDREESGPIVGTQGAEAEEMAGEGGLEIEGHGMECVAR